MEQEEKIKLAELIRNNLDLPVIATLNCDSDDLPFTTPVVKANIRDYAGLGNGRIVARTPLTEKIFSEDTWKPAIFVYLED